MRSNEVFTGASAVQCLLVYYVNELLKNFKEMNSIWRNHLNHCRWQSRSASILRTSIRASQICINRFQIKDLCQDWNKEYLLQATFPSFVPPGECNNFVESLFSGIEGSQAGPESFGNEVMLGISLNIQETIGHKAREGISYIIHTGWAGSSQISSILRQTRWVLSIGGCYLNLL